MIGFYCHWHLNIRFAHFLWSGFQTYNSALIYPSIFHKSQCYLRIFISFNYCSRQLPYMINRLLSSPPLNCSYDITATVLLELPPSLNDLLFFLQSPTKFAWPHLLKANIRQLLSTASTLSSHKPQHFRLCFSLSFVVS